MGNSDRRNQVARAAGFAITVMLASAGVAAVAGGIFALSRGATLGEAWTTVAGAYPLQAAVAVLAGAATLTLLLSIWPVDGASAGGARSPDMPA